MLFFFLVSQFIPPIYSKNGRNIFNWIQKLINTKKTYAGKQQFILYEMLNVIIPLPLMNGNKGESKRPEPPKNDNI